jgi:hypothetical protein
MTFECVKPNQSCAFYHHYADAKCQHPVNNHTLICGSCDTEGGTEFDILNCNVSAGYTWWHGGCNEKTCDWSSCKYSGKDHVGACLATPAGSKWPAVMLLGFGECPQFVLNTSYPNGSGCKGEETYRQFVQVDECKLGGNTLWMC